MIKIITLLIIVFCVQSCVKQTSLNGSWYFISGQANEFAIYSMNIEGDSLEADNGFGIKDKWYFEHSDHSIFLYDTNAIICEMAYKRTSDSSMLLNNVNYVRYRLQSKSDQPTYDIIEYRTKLPLKITKNSSVIHLVKEETGLILNDAYAEFVDLPMFLFGSHEKHTCPLTICVGKGVSVKNLVKVYVYSKGSIKTKIDLITDYSGFQTYFGLQDEFEVEDSLFKSLYRKNNLPRPFLKLKKGNKQPNFEYTIHYFSDVNSIKTFNSESFNTLYISIEIEMEDYLKLTEYLNSKPYHDQIQKIFIES